MAGIIINDDFMRFVASKYHENYAFGETTETDVRNYIRQFRGTTVTDFVFNVNAQMSYTPSDVWYTAEDKYNATEEKGHAVDFKNTFYKVWYDLFVLQSVDMYKIWIEELRKMHIHPWISFRMNDIHDNDKPYGGIRRSPYFGASREKGLCRTNHREKAGYFDDCFDWKHEEVRNYHLAYIKEQTARYDTDGIELDFMREPFLCSPGEEGKMRVIVTDFVREVRKIADLAEQKHGHKIKLSVRCFRDIETAYNSGMDVFGLVREGLVDLLIPSPRWRTCDTDMPLYLWKRIFEKDNIKLAAGCDLLYVSAQRKDIHLNHETLAALSMQYQSNGADYIYLYNHTYTEDFEPYSYLGDLDLLAKKERRHIMSFQDLSYLYMSEYKPLPVALNKDYSFLRIQTGRIENGSKVILRLGAEKNLKDVYVNSVFCKKLGEVQIESEYYALPVQEFEISVYNQDEQIVEVKCEETATLTYAEIRVIP
ncbi:MAG: hypothetical protein IKJ55_01120 [Clostridia bacterium]|nr:hypothetical protein [Clostridia bacterium]